MNKLLWLVVIPMAVSACVHQAGYFEPSEWDKVCAAVEAEYGEDKCAGLSAPQVVQTKLLTFFGALGVFVHDEQYVFVTDDITLLLNGVTFDEVVFHESVHYILWYSDTIRGNDKATSCASEAAARKITAKQYDKPEGNWRVVYGCQAPGAPWRTGV